MSIQIGPCICIWKLLDNNFPEQCNIKKCFPKSYGDNIKLAIQEVCCMLPGHPLHWSEVLSPLSLTDWPPHLCSIASAKIEPCCHSPSVQFRKKSQSYLSNITSYLPTYVSTKNLQRGLIYMHLIFISKANVSGLAWCPIYLWKIWVMKPLFYAR